MHHSCFSRFIVALILTIILGNNPIKANEISTNITAESSIDQIIDELAGTTMQVLHFTFENQEFPSYDVIEAPEGCMGKSIINNSYVKGSLVITLSGKEIYNSGAYEDKESGVRVKNRGNTSTAQEYIIKKSFKIKLSKKADLLFREDKKYRDKDWVLLSGNKDLYYEIGTKVAKICGMEWEPCGVPVFVIMNHRYMGYYYLVESIKASDGRVDIQDSGFIIENDAYWWKPDELYFKSVYLPYAVGWTFKEPDPDDIEEKTLSDIKNVVDWFENVLYSHEYIDDMYDKESFSRWILAHDILGTIDGLGSNIFVTKENYETGDPFNTKLKMGPLWDFDDCFQSDDNAHARLFLSSYFWYGQLLLYSDFYETLLKNWNQVKNVLLDELKPCIEEFLYRYPDIYHARQIDFNLGLLGRTPLSDPWQEYMEKMSWIENRLIALNNLYSEIPVIKIVIENSKMEISAGETFTIEPLVYPDIATDKTITWKSTDSGIATVSETGEVAGVAPGRALIMAIGGYGYAQCEVTVLDDSGIESILGNKDSKISVYTIDGVMIGSEWSPEDLKTMPKGIYIIISGKYRYKLLI